MADLRLLIAAALNSSDLSQSDISETAIDRVGALAFTDALGGALWALKWAGEIRGYRRAMLLLTRRSRRLAIDFPMRRKLCHAALFEWYFDRCHACGGRRVVIPTGTDTSPVRPCTVCNGTGRGRPSEVWRASQLGLEPVAVRKWNKKIDAVHQKIADAETQAWRDVSGQLGRRQRDLLSRRPLTPPRPAVYSSAASPGTTTRTPKPAEGKAAGSAAG